MFMLSQTLEDYKLAKQKVSAWLQQAASEITEKLFSPPWHILSLGKFDADRYGIFVNNDNNSTGCPKSFWPGSRRG